MVTSIISPVFPVHADGKSIVDSINNAVAKNKVPVNGALTQTAAGALGARTEFVRCSWQTPNGELACGAETSLAVSANNVLNVAAPGNAPAVATGWNVYVWTATNGEVKQNGAPIALGTAWVQPTTGDAAGGQSYTAAGSAYKGVGAAIHVSVAEVKKAIAAATGIAIANIVLSHDDRFSIANAISNAVAQM